MSRVLQWGNFVGVLGLMVLCGFQWQANRRANLEVGGLDRTRVAQAAQLAEREQTIKGYVDDMNDFRQRLSGEQSARREAEAARRGAEAQVAALTADMSRLSAERDELKANAEAWVSAVAARDAALRQAGEHLQATAAERDAAIAKFNDLANKYNLLVDDLNKARAKH